MDTIEHGRTCRGHSALRRGRASLPNHIYHVTTATRSRRAVFDHFAAGCAAASAFTHPGCLGDARLLAWVLMPDHAHWLVNLGPVEALDLVVNRMKARSARAANLAIGQDEPIWQRGYFDRALRAEDDVRTVARYIIGNPVRAGLATRVGDYALWDAVWLQNTADAGELL